MAEQVLTKQKLINADEDLGDLEEVLNGPPGKLVKTRLGREVYTLASVPQINTMTREEVTAAVVPKANDAEVYKKNETLTKEETYALVAPKANQDDVDTALSNLSTAANKFYPTLAAATADIANISINQPVTVSEVANGGLWYKATSGATTLTKSPYDPLLQGKNYTDAYATVKPKVLSNGTDFRTITTPGVYLVTSNASAATMLNCPSNYAGVLEVLAVSTTTLTQRYTPNESTKRFYQCGSNSGNWTAWEDVLIGSAAYQNYMSTPRTLTNGTDFNTVNTSGFYKVSSNASAATMLNCPSARAGVLEVLAISTTQIVQRYTPYGIDKKFFQRASNTGIWPSIWEEILFKSDSDALYATKEALSEITDATINSLTQTDFYGKKYSQEELKGSALYANGVYVGLNSIYEHNAIFNSVEARIFNTSSSEIEYRVYMGSDIVASSVNGFYVNKVVIDSHSFEGVCKSFPKNDSGEAQEILLDKVISIPKNTPFVVAFKAVDSTKFSIAYGSAVTGNLENRSFNLSQTLGNWSDISLGNASLPTYTQAGFKLILNLPNTSAANPNNFIPALVLPKKIYSMHGLETNIYFKHMLADDYKDYFVDVISAKGNHKDRKWVFNPLSTEVASDTQITIELHDKKTGDLLTSAKSTLTHIATSANAGTKKVCVIGDSYINAGVITQTLLDNAANDVTKIKLIGTRGAELNKHEGRGGWRIDDYATAGRTYYSFNVSGVVEAPEINSTIYTYSGGTFTVQETNLVSGSGTIVCDYTGAAPTSGTSGTLTKLSGNGDSTILFNNVQPVSGNPFWIEGVLNFGQYLANNSLETPDYVIVQLGVNDSFNMLSDSAVESLTVTAFAQLDMLITSIKAANSNVKIGLNLAPTYADQNAFAVNYQSGRTSWRANRNIVIWNKKLIERYGANTNNVFVVASGYNVDPDYNFQTANTTPNKRNSTVIVEQSNGVHPAASGYQQIADQDFIFIKAN